MYIAAYIGIVSLFMLVWKRWGDRMERYDGKFED